jgi:hypothetical protein
MAIPTILKFSLIYLLAYEDRTECSGTLAYKIQTPGNYPEETIQHTEHGKILKSRNVQGIHKMKETIIYFNLKVKITTITIFLETPEGYHKHPEGTYTQG